MRALAHTLGADAVFVALHLACARIRGGGLVRWDNAAACTRGRCRPDGYGVCRFDGQEVGFFVEYDRGTARARDYAGKWDAYYRYRDSGRAARDFTSFPTILVVTAGSEDLVMRTARAAAMGRATAGLPILVTTTGWIAGHREGILGPVWRSPACADRRYRLRGSAAEDPWGRTRAGLRAKCGWSGQHDEGSVRPITVCHPFTGSWTRRRLENTAIDTAENSRRRTRMLVVMAARG